MKNPILILVLTMLAFSFFQCKSDDGSGECICPEIYAPVCGDDGIVYGNSCEAECAGVEYTSGFCPQEKEGIVLDMGDQAVDGCGWVIQIFIDYDLVGQYRPDTLLPGFKIDGLDVLVKYKLTLDEFPCGLKGTIPIIEVLEIEAL